MPRLSSREAGSDRACYTCAEAIDLPSASLLGLAGAPHGNSVCFHLYFNEL